MAVKARAEITLSSIRDVQSVTRYYLLQSSTSAVPSKPTTNPPGGNWVTAEPTYTSGSTNSLYFVDLTVFSDGTFAYSDVSLSSSYEAAKVAYNKAASAEDVANSASDKVDNLEVGGRNLLPGTETFSIWYTNNSSITFHDGIIDIGNATSNQWRFIGSPSIELSDVEGKDITVSMDIRSDDYEELATQNYPSVSLFLKNRGPEACNFTYRVKSAPGTILSKKVTSEWTRISFTHKNISVDTFTTKYAEGDAPWLSLGFWAYTKNSFQIRNIKMETGNIPTDWTPAPEDLESDISAANALAQSAKDTADGKITTFYAASTATPTATTVGDLWIKTDDGNSLCRWNGTAWVSVDNADIQSALKAAGTAQATADSKVITFAQASTPTATDIGDIWIDTDDSNRMYRWNGTAWVDVHDPKIAEANEKIDNLEIGGRNLIRRTDYAIYGNSNNYANANQAIFSSDRITIPFGKEVWHYQYTRNELKTPIPKGTKIIMSVYVYEQTVPDGNHRLYVAGLRSTGTVNWYSNYKVIPYGFVGKFTWEHTTLEDFYGFLLDFDTRNGTSGQIVLGPVKAEIGTLATDWTPAPEDIEDSISAANTLAQSAKNTADGKITTFYAASTATPTATTVGDLWIDTDDSNRMYRWNGTAWVDVHDPKIAEANEKIDNLQIGGRNLLLNSEHFIPDSGIFSGSNANLYTNATFDSEGLYYASGSKYVKVTFPNLTIGEQYAFSCEVARQSGGSSTPVYITINGEEAVEVGTAKELVWTQFSTVFTASASTTYAKVQVYTAVSSGNAGWVAHFRHFKLERGNRATDWTPAPEDVIEAGISAANEAVDGLQIGGRNLIINTLYPNVSLAENRPKLLGQIGTTTGSGTVSAAEHGLRFTNTAVNWQYIYFGLSSNNAAVDMLGLEPGETYTLSADLSWKLYSAEGQIATTYYIGAFLAYSTVESGSFTMLNMPNQIPIAQADKGTEMSGRLVYTFTVPTTAKRLYLGIRGDVTTTKYYAVGDYIEARNLKLEKGTKVTDWTPAPEDLENAITTSQETADGKNTVYYQNSAPTNQTFKVNDIWFDTDDENKMYHWNGSAWTAAPFGNAAFSNIDAGKVTTGTMSAARIKGDILTLGGANNVDGMLKVYDANGTLVGSFTREGLMAITGSIGGWTIGEEDLTGEWDVGTEHWMVGLSKSYGLRFKEVPQGGDPATDWTREVQYNAGLASYSSKENGETYHGAVENYPGEDGLRIYPKLIIGDHSASTVTEISTNQIDTTKVRLTELWAHPLGHGDSFYMQQPLMIMSGVVTISTGTSEKNLTLCTIPAAYQSGYRIVPFVSRRYGSASGTPSDTGDFYYAYYNSVTHNVHIKLANKLPSGTIFQFDYMIYAVPES